MLLLSLLCGCGNSINAAIPLATQTEVPPYHRSEFPHWSDLQPPWGCDTRSEILQRDVDSQGEQVVSKNRRGCVVKVYIVDPYTEATTDDVDVDHIVALEDAWYSGAYAWTREERERFANDPGELLAVSASANRAKGSHGPDAWQPPNIEFWCTYGTLYRDIKAQWHLTISSPQEVGITALLRACTNPT